MYIIKNSKKSGGVVFFDLDKFKRELRYSIQMRHPKEFQTEILNKCVIKFSNGMEDYARDMMMILRDKGVKVEELIDLSRCEEEEFNINFSVFDNDSGTIKAKTTPVKGQVGEYDLVIEWGGLIKTCNHSF